MLATEGYGLSSYLQHAVRPRESRGENEKLRFCSYLLYADTLRQTLRSGCIDWCTDGHLENVDFQNTVFGAGVRVLSFGAIHFLDGCFVNVTDLFRCMDRNFLCRHFKLGHNECSITNHQALAVIVPTFCQRND